MFATVPGGHPLLTLSVVLVAGIAFGSLAKRFRLPAVTGQILVGVLIARLGLFTTDAIGELEPFIDFALGLMAVAVGSHLVLRRLLNAKKRLALLLLFEVTLTPVLVFLATIWHGDTTWQSSLLMAAIAVSTAPATVLALVKETHSKGVFVKTLLAATALNNLACIGLFELAHTAAQVSLDPARGHSLGSLFLAPLWELARAAVLGASVGAGLVVATRHVVRPDRLAAVSVLAILLTIGLADYAETSVLLACLFLGLTLANLTPDKEEIGHQVFANFEYAIFAIFFTMAGMELRFEYLAPGGVVALLLFLARFAGKVGSARLAMRVAGATDRVRRWLGFALIPQAGLAVGLTLLVTEEPLFAGFQGLFLAVVLTAVLLNEIAGPILCRYALLRSGDFGKDRARLIDFLHEEHIRTDLQAATMEEAIARLTDHLVRTCHLKVDRDALLRGFLQREAQGSTCLGSGLAIPHGPLDSGDSIVGVMGISRDGLRFDTPDGRPVHCVVLLATPPAARGRHLEVLAAFARVIGKDRTIRQQLYHAETPAHAYELLHAEEASEDWNYFLDEEEPPPA